MCDLTWHLLLEAFRVARRKKENLEKKLPFRVDAGAKPVPLPNMRYGAVQVIFEWAAISI